MEWIHRKTQNNPKDYPVYTKKEADDHGITYHYWKKPVDTGDFVISDDEYVAEVIRAYGPYKNDRRALLLPYCKTWIDEKGTLNFRDYYGNGDYSHMNTGTWADRESKSARTKRVVRLYAMILMKKGRVTLEDKKRLAKLYRPDQETPVATFIRLFKQPKIKKMIDKELEKLLLEQEITPTTVIEQYKDTRTAALKADQCGVAKGVTDRFAEMLGMIGKKGGHSNDGPKRLEEGEQESEIFGIMERTESSLIETPDDEMYIDELADAKPAKNGKD